MLCAMERPTRQKNLSFDSEVLTDFEQFCKDRNLAMGRTMTSLMYWVMTTTPDEREEIMLAFAKQESGDANMPPKKRPPRTSKGGRGAVEPDE